MTDSEKLKIAVDALKSIAFEDQEEAISPDFWCNSKDLKEVVANDTNIAREALRCIATTSRDDGAMEWYICDIYEGCMGAYNTKQEAIDKAWMKDENNVYHVREVLP